MKISANRKLSIIEHRARLRDVISQIDMFNDSLETVKEKIAEKSIVIDLKGSLKINQKRKLST